MTTTLFDQAVQAHQRGRFSEAESLYRQIISRDPKNFDALHMLGIICANTGKIPVADKLFRAALSIDPALPLFDTQRFIRNIEAAYAEAYRRYQAGLQPDHIQVALVPAV